VFNFSSTEKFQSGSIINFKAIYQWTMDMQLAIGSAISNSQMTKKKEFKMVGHFEIIQFKILIVNLSNN